MKNKQDFLARLYALQKIFGKAVIVLTTMH